MNSKNNLTTGNAAATLVKFAIPFLLACFLQTFYGMVDMYVVGKYNGAGQEYKKYHGKYHAYG